MLFCLGVRSHVQATTSLDSFVPTHLISETTFKARIHSAAGPTKPLSDLIILNCTRFPVRSFCLKQLGDRFDGNHKNFFPHVLTESKSTVV